jgi:hypothetical protein
MYPEAIRSSADCRAMGLEEFGLYMWLLLLAWESPVGPAGVESTAGWLVYEPGRLAKQLKLREKKFREVFAKIEKKFYRVSAVDDTEHPREFLVNPRLMREAEIQAKASQARSAVGKKGGRPKAPEKPVKSLREEAGNTTTVAGTPLPTAEFLERWERYPRKYDRAAAYRSWQSHVNPEEDLPAVDRALEHYIQYVAVEVKDPRYVKHGSTWFRNWKDWVEWVPTVVTGVNGKPGKWNGRQKTIDDVYPEVTEEEPLVRED